MFYWLEKTKKKTELETFLKLAAHPTNPSKAALPSFRQDFFRFQSPKNKLQIRRISTQNFDSCYQNCSQEIQIRQCSQGLPATTYLCLETNHHHLWKVFMLVGKPSKFQRFFPLRKQKVPKWRQSKIGSWKHIFKDLKVRVNLMGTSISRESVKHFELLWLGFAWRLLLRHVALRATNSVFAREWIDRPNRCFSMW